MEALEPILGLVALAVIVGAVGAIAARLQGSGDSGNQPRETALAKSSAVAPSKKTPEDDASAKFHEYELRPTLLTSPEQVLFGRLLAGLPTYTIAAQVQLSQLIKPALTDQRQAALNRINRKSIDFVILNDATRAVVAVELDDASHNRPDRRKSDDVKDKALECAQLPLIRYHVKDLPSADRIAQDVSAALTRTQSV